MKVYRQWVPCERNSSYNFKTIFLKLCTWFLRGLEMCVWFGYNLWVNFCHFFYFVNFVIFWHQILWKCKDSGYLVSATRYTIVKRSLWNFEHDFSMVCRCACGLDIILELIFVTFSTLWTLSFFNFSQVRHQLHWSRIYISYKCPLSNKRPLPLFMEERWLNAGFMALKFCIFALILSQECHL